MDRRKLVILQFLEGETPQSTWSSIVELVGDIKTPDGRTHWPYTVLEVLEKDHLRMRDRLIWSGFCYQNGVPFGLMIAYPHLCGALRDEAAYMDLMNSWCNDKRALMDSMTNLMTYDRFMLTERPFVRR